MTAPPKRRWFKFDLRTMFVVVTIFGVWLGWQLRVVRERKAILAEIERSGPGLADLHLYWLPGPKESYAGPVDLQNYEAARISSVRQLLGDNARRTLVMPASLGPQWVERAEYAFPETELFIYRSRPGSASEPNYSAFRDSLYKPAGQRETNQGSVFKTGLIER